MPFLISPLLWLCVALSAGGCNPNQDPTGPEPSQTLTATEIAGIRLTYMCGNSFRVRNPNAQEVMVTWDVYQKSETGSLTLPPKPAGAPHSETFFTTVNKGTVRLFYNGQLIQTKANGNKPPCQTGGQQPADWPRVSESPMLDATKLVTLPNDTTQLYRTEVMMAFGPSVSETEKQSIFTSLGLNVLGVLPSGIFFVRFADRGPSIEAYRAFVDSLRAKPGVQTVAPILRTPLEEVQNSRYPTDGTGQVRADWFTSTNATWAKRAIRLPEAWGCENGTYGGASLPVGALEWKHDKDHPEFASSAPVLWQPRDSWLDSLGIQAWPADTVAAKVLHATQVVGTFTASGDNNSGTAGVMWKTNLRLYSVYSSGNRPLHLIRDFSQIAEAVRQDGIRVLTASVDGRLPANLTQTDKEHHIENLARELRRLLDASPQLTIIVASGNDRFKGTYAAYLQQVSKPAVLLSALLKVRSETAYQDRVIVVTGTQQNNVFWDSWYRDPTQGASYFVGSTDIAAPAQDIVTLDRRTGASVPVTGPIIAGTSLAAPMVAGVAAQLLAMDPTLTTGQVKDYIVRGAQEKRVDHTTGLSVPPPPVSGLPEPVYQLDAYGALSLLSRERTGTPICAFPVSLTEAGDAVLLQRRQNSVETVPMPARATAVSVAQGGRLMAVSLVDTDDPVPHEFRFQNGVWSDVRTLTQGYERRYLERDTVDLRWDEATSHTFATIRRADGSVTAIDLNQTAEPAQLYGFALREPFFSPSGDFVLVGGHYTFQEGCPTWLEGKRWHLLRLPSGPATLLEDNVMNTCNHAPGEILTDEEGTAAWSLDGTRFALGIIQMMLRQPERDQYTHYQSRLIEGVVSGTSATIRDVTTSGRSVHPYAYSPGNEVISAQENLLVDPTTLDCKRTTRLVQSLGTVLTESPATCFSPAPVLMNSVASLQLDRLGSRLVGSLKPSRGHSAVRPPTPRRVQVN